MKPLPLRPLPKPLEPLTDYLERLAYANGYHAGDLWFVLSRNGEEHGRILVDALNGNALPEFSGPSDPHIDIQVNQFGLNVADFTHFPHRWCPRCIEHEPWLRPIWRLKAAPVCAEHRLRLLECCPSCGKWVRFPEILRGVCECGIRFLDAAVPVARRHIRLANALEGSLKGPVLIELETETVSMSTQQLVRLICHVGRLREGPGLYKAGKRPNLGGLDVSFSVFDGAATLIDNWPSIYWQILDKYAEAAPDDPSLRRVFNPLYRVIYHHLRDPVNQFLRTGFEAYLLDHWRGELCGRHRLFDEKTIAAHPRQGLTRVARVHGVGSQTLRRLVHHEWLPAKCFARSPKRQFITLDARQVSALIPDPGDYLDLRSAARVLGIKRSRLRELVGVGTIMADSHPTWRRRNQWYFRRHDVLGLLDGLRRSAVQEIASADTVRLNHVLQCWRVSTAELGALMEAMKQQEIPFSLAPSGQLQDAVFDAMDLHLWIDKCRNTETEWVSVTKAARLLGLKEQVVYGLVANNLLAASLVRRKGSFTKRISSASLNQFRQEYVSLAELAKRSNRQPRALMQQISAKPITGPNVDGGRQYFYRREALPDYALNFNLFGLNSPPLAA